MTVALRRPEAVIFDWDSTLADNWGAIARSLNTVLVAMGQEPWSDEQVRRHATRSARGAFGTLFGERRDEALALFYRNFEAVHAEEVRPLRGADDLLAGLNSHGIPVCVVSNKNGRYLRAEAERLGWTRKFVRLVGAADAPRDKPDTAPVRLALAETGVRPGPGVWFVGDSSVDLQCAHLASCVPILLQGGVISPAELGEWPPAHVFGCRTDLLAAFQACMSYRQGDERRAAEGRGRTDVTREDRKPAGSVPEHPAQDPSAGDDLSDERG